MKPKAGCGATSCAFIILKAWCVITLLDKLNQLNLPSRIALAISGGPDSMALLTIAQQWARMRNAHVHALIVDHQLRPQSQDEALQVAQWVAAHHIDYTILTCHYPYAVSTNIQKKARDERFNLMTHWCKQNDYTHLLLAHHALDQLETFLMRLNKASGLKGLCCMQTTSVRQGITLVRPFLDTHPALLHAAYPDPRYIQDPSNANPQFERVRYRSVVHHLLDIGFELPNLQHALGKLTEVNDYLESEAERHLKSLLILHNATHIVLDLPGLKALPYIIIERILLKLLVRSFQYPPRYRSLKMIDQKIRDPLFQAATIAGHCLRRARNKLIISQEIKAYDIMSR